MWVKFDDQTPNDPVIDALSDGAFRLWFSAICYCQAELTNGFVSETKLRRLTPNYRPAHLRELLDAGRFIPLGDGFTIKNFEKWNRTAEYWIDKRKRDADRLAKWRAENGLEPREELR